VTLSHKGLKSILELSKNRSHGDRLRYMAGCRCVPCRAANSRYECERLAARKAGDWNGCVSAAKARKHLEKLSRQGVGRNSICEASGVARSIVARIKNGKKKLIRRRTETKILAVTADARADHSIVPAARTWRLINRLLQEGFSKAEIARRLGRQTPALQIRKDFILARTAVAVERLYNRVMA
jgi:hypothetical protein